MPYSSCGGVQVLKSRKVITDDKMTVHPKINTTIFLDIVAFIRSMYL